MLRAAILGATGYTALELIRILLRHPEVEVTAATSRQPGTPLADVHPILTGKTNLKLEDLSPQSLAERADVVFCCLPHVASMEAVPGLLHAGLRVVDLSADYRLRDPGVYEQWYGHVHTDPTRLGSTVYGLPELFADRIPAADLVANPGCYTSTSILAIAPLVCGGLIKSQGIIIDAKSGVSGAGRTPKLNILYSEANESLSVYSVGNHRHTPEIEQVLSEASGQPVEVLFTPHLTPMDRGILATIYAEPLQPDLTQSQLLDVMREFYAGRPFVRVVEHLPATKHVAGTNEFHVTVRIVRGRVLLIAVLDNLLKGAAGVAVQNLNLMYGFPE
ncbi:MAG: N-acetyl-gamma-glutamyl-phosphate reductase [Planctomycetaceae bacterium]|nr:N-acetyl-gamma-glutamyl-phosphate reductase [Planctomycetaceae bacterium]